MKVDHDIRLECYALSGHRLGVFRPDWDWDPVREYLRFAALRRPDFLDEDFAGEIVLEPVWESGVGPPYAGSLRARLERGGGRAPLLLELPLPWFARYARAASASLIERGLLKSGDEFRYLIRAEASNGQARVGTTDRFAAVVASIVPRRREGVLAEKLEGTLPLGPRKPGDHHVFIPRNIIEEATALTEQTSEVETGAILAGHLYHDAEAGPFLEVTALVPAEHTRADTHKLTFTAETWAAANRALRAMNPEPLLVGWFHTHPAKKWCRADCETERRRQCPLQRQFFSADDRLLHRASFPAAYSVALVATDADSGISFALYGWRNADIAGRGFHLLNPDGHGGPVVGNDSATYANHETEEHHATDCSSHPRPVH